MVNIAGILNCEIADDPVYFVSQDKPNFVTGFHGQVRIVNIIAGNLNAGETYVLLITGDRAIEDVSDVDFFSFFGSSLGDDRAQLELGDVIWIHM